jgi:putative copper resistance protein D
MDVTDLTAVLLRGAHLGALASLFGVLVFRAAILRSPPETLADPLLRRRLSLLIRTSLLLALVLGIAWFLERSSAIAGTDLIRETLEAVPDVALRTQFGRIALLRLLLLLALIPLWFRFPDQQPGARPGLRRILAGRARLPARQFYLPAALVLAGGALALQALTSHAGAVDGNPGRLLVLEESLHILAAGAWLGSLAPLLICLATLPGRAVAVVLRRFFPLGLICVLVIAATSLEQALSLVGGIPALFGTTYGLIALLKLLLFLSLLVLAVLNRFWFGPRAGQALRRSIAGEAGLAVLTLLAAGALAQLTPGVHEQAVWPFAWRLNTNETGPLFTRAWPSTFYVSPTGFAADAIVRGAHAYQANCANCHGATGLGDGGSVASLPAAPPNLTERRILDYSDGDLFHLVGHSGALAEADRWDLVDYLRAHVTGEFVRTSGRGQLPTRIPRFDAVCADGRVLDSDDMRGAVLRVVVPINPKPTLVRTQADTPLLTVSLPANAADRVDETPCAAQYEAREAFAILLGVTSDSLAGSEFLIDTNGWLRARWRPGEPGGWPSAHLLTARVRVLARSPLPAGPLVAHVHTH